MCARQAGLTRLRAQTRQFCVWSGPAWPPRRRCAPPRLLSPRVLAELLLTSRRARVSRWPAATGASCTSSAGTPISLNLWTTVCAPRVSCVSSHCVPPLTVGATPRPPSAAPAIDPTHHRATPNLPKPPRWLGAVTVRRHARTHMHASRKLTAQSWAARSSPRAASCRGRSGGRRRYTGWQCCRGRAGPNRSRRRT